MFCLDRCLPKRDTDLDGGSAFIRKLRQEIAQGGVTSLPVTPGSAYEHFGGKTGDNLNMDSVGH